MKRITIFSQFTIITLLTSSYCLAMENVDLSTKKNQKKYTQKKAWTYLASAPFKERLQKAADFVSDCDTIIEIGGGDSSIDRVMNQSDKKIIVVDPVCKRMESGHVTHIRSTFQRWKADIASRNYAVVLLGLKLEKMDIQDWNKLYTLIDGAKKLVLEYSAENEIGRSQAKIIAKNINKQCVEQETFDCAIPNEEKHSSRVYPHRAISYFE